MRLAARRGTARHPQRALPELRVVNRGTVNGRSKRQHRNGVARRPSKTSPAVAYVRMSTDHQKYSTENQLDVIRKYAETRGLTILRTFKDSGRSGLRLDGREALQNLMAEVQSGQADFKAILVL